MCHLCEPGRISRRHLIGSSLAMAGLAATWPGGQAFAAAAHPPATAGVPGDVALARLIDGNARYVADKPAIRNFTGGRAARAQGQHPIAAIVACADSRVSPELFLDQGPGELFIVRVAGNFVDPEGLASLEYAVKFLGVRLVMVIGHSSCGAVSAALQVIQEGAKLPGHLPHLVSAIKPAIRPTVARKPADLLFEAINDNVRYNVAKLHAPKSLIGGFVKAGTVKVAGGYYDIATDKVTLL